MPQYQPDQPSGSRVSQYSIEEVTSNGEGQDPNVAGILHKLEELDVHNRNSGSASNSSRLSPNANS
jgi:hypothetical protein